jgi:hypothetical protein
MKHNPQQSKCKIKLKKNLTKRTKKKKTRASPPNPASWIMRTR